MIPLACRGEIVWITVANLSKFVANSAAHLGGGFVFNGVLATHLFWRNPREFIRNLPAQRKRLVRFDLPIIPLQSSRRLRN